MANFEIRIYVLSNDEINQLELDTSTVYSDWTDKEFISYAEDSGNVFTLCNLFSSTRMLDNDTEVARAYLINIDNENAEPIRCDYYKTILSVNKVISHSAEYNETTKEVVDVPITRYEEPVQVPIGKTYTIVVTNTDSETTTDDIVHELELLRDVMSVNVITETTDGKKIRLSVEAEIGCNYDLIEETIDNMGMQDCEFIELNWDY